MLIYITPDISLVGETEGGYSSSHKSGGQRGAVAGERCTLFFQSGLQRLHLRMPNSSVDECRALLDTIPQCYHPRIVIHDHFSLLNEYNLCGVHLNHRNPQPPEGWKGHVSVSCHSIEELAMRKKESDYQYLTLSPIFDSISKQGYRAAFTRDQLMRAKADGIIDQRVIALGGITRENIDKALSYGFGGVMMLGDAWHTQSPPIVLTIAGSDSSAGAGIQQDLKTITNYGCYAATVITAITSQNTLGVQGVMPVPADVVESQLRSVLSDLRIDAVKIGMIPNRSVAEVIARVLGEQRRKQVLPIVLDPVMMSSSGTRLMTDDCIRYVSTHLMPLATLATPNIPERGLLKTIPTNTLVKGGHADGNDMTDTLHLIDESATVAYTLPRIHTTNLHGTGCTLSSAIAASMAQGKSLQTAVSEAKQYVQRAITGGKDLKIGKGNGPLWIPK